MGETLMADISRIPIIDVDSHLTEPADLWTARIPDKWKDDVPLVRFNEQLGEAEWWVGQTKLHAVGSMTMGGWKEYMPSRPPTFEDMDDGAYTSHGRLRKLDEFGIHAQILFPNIMGFYTQAFLRMDRELSLRCVQVYNDFQTEFADADPERLLPVAVLPFWDVEASVAELDRCADMGFTSVLFASTFDRIGLPALVDPAWDPVLKRAEERRLPLNFHVGFSMFSEQDMNNMVKAKDVGFNRGQYAKSSTLFLLGNISCIAEIAMTGLAVRYPDLKFVSVESGFGYVPYLLEAMDWQWLNSGAHLDNPGHPLPSEVVRNQVFATFWFEKDCFDLLPLLENNVMFASDYPHPTSLTPGPATIAEDARTTAIKHLSKVPESIARKVLCENACRLFNLPIPGDLPEPERPSGESVESLA
jgi:predicted TIM-barrel fold metal-dependent hydrolase